MKKEIVKEQKDVNKIRKEWESHYNEYFYQTFYQSFNVEGIDFQQEDFLKSKLFYEGSIACFNIKWTESNEFNPNGIACFTSFAGVKFNIYNFPIYAMLINNRGVPFIPNTDIDFNQYFRDIVGVSLPTDHIEPEEIVLQFDKDRFPYVVTKPIHHSQTIEDKELHIIKLFVRPNKELESRILSYGDQVEVLRPQWLREQIAEKISKIAKKYSIVQNDCTDK